MWGIPVRNFRRSILMKHLKLGFPLRGLWKSSIWRLSFTVGCLSWNVCVCVCVCWDTVISVQVDPVWPFDGGRNVRVSGTGECRRGVCLQSEREVRLVSSVRVCVLERAAGCWTCWDLPAVWDLKRSAVIPVTPQAHNCVFYRTILDVES